VFSHHRGGSPLHLLILPFGLCCFLYLKTILNCFEYANGVLTSAQILQKTSVFLQESFCSEVFSHHRGYIFLVRFIFLKSIVGCSELSPKTWTKL